MPDRLESGTANVGGIIALGAGIDFIRKTGRETIYQKEYEHIMRFYNSLSHLQAVNCYVQRERLREFSPVLSFNITGIPSETVAQELAEQGICVRAGLHCAPLAHRKIGTDVCGTVRISPSFFTSDKEINCAISSIKKLI